MKPRTPIALACCLLFFGIAAAAAPACAQLAGSIRGQVVSQMGAPIVGAHITAASTRAAFSAESAADGRFIIGPLPEGVYALTATARGYARLSGQVVSVVAAVRRMSPSRCRPHRPPAWRRWAA